MDRIKSYEALQDTNDDANDDQHNNHHMNHPSELMADHTIDHDPELGYNIDQDNTIVKLPNDGITDEIKRDKGWIGVIEENNVENAD